MANDMSTPITQTIETPVAAEPYVSQPKPVLTRRERMRPYLFAALPIALIAGGYVYATGGRVMATDNAYVEADLLGIATDVAGIVSEIDVHDNQAVKAGDVLFKLDSQPLQLALDSANAQVDIVRNDLAALKTTYADMQAQIVQAQADIDYYQVEFNRQQTLADVRAASRSAFDIAQHNLSVAQQKKASLIQQLAGISANLNGNPEAAVEEHPRYRNAIAARDEAARQLAHATVKAPVNGIVTNVPALQLGQYLKEGTAAFSIVSSDNVWVEASPKETELTYVRPGQAVTVTVDTYPGVEWAGKVESISPASGSSFSLLPAQNTTGNWVKVVQRIPMRIAITDATGKPPLRVGMSVTAEVDTGHTRGLHIFGSTPAHAGNNE